MAFNVNGDGSVSNVNVVTAQTSGSARGAAFCKASIEAIEKDRFLPEPVDGRPVVTHMRMPIIFDIDGYAAGQLRHPLDALMTRLAAIPST